MPISHAKVSAVADGPDATLVRPSDWNADHVGDSFDPASRLIIHDDLLTGNTPFDGGFTTESSGTGSGTSSVPGEASHPGLQNFSTGTTTTGRSGLAASVNAIIFGGGMRCQYGAIFKIATLSDGTETFTVRGGFLDALSTDGNDGVYFRYTDAVNGGQWEGVTRNNSVESTIDTNVTADTDYHRFEIDVAADGSSAEFFIDGLSVGTISTNIPTAAGRETGLRPWHIVKSAGTTARQVRGDAYWYIFELTTAR